MVSNIWIEAARPKTLIAGAAPVFLGSALAIRLGSFTPSLFFFTLLTGLSIQIATNYVNDYFDYIKGADTKERLGPRRIMSSGLATKEEMKKALFLIFSMGVLFSLPLIAVGGPIIALLMVLAILCAFAYTTGPFPIAYYGGSEFFVIFFFSMIPTLMTTYLQTHFYLPESLLIGFGAGLFATALLTIANLRDFQADQKVGKKTLIVRFGPSFGKWEYAFCLIGGSLVPFFLYFFFKHDPRILFASPLIPALVACRKAFKAKTPTEYLPLLPLTANIFIVFTIVLAITLVL